MRRARVVDAAEPGERAALRQRVLACALGLEPAGIVQVAAFDLARLQELVAEDVERPVGAAQDPRAGRRLVHRTSTSHTYSCPSRAFHVPQWVRPGGSRVRTS